MNQEHVPDDHATIPALPQSVPVVMPSLPPRRTITTMQQFKAVSDPTRSRILGIIQHQPATAKQIADRLEAAPGAIGHHLRVLEEAGLVQVVARRVTRGIIANYYTRTARIFNYELPPDVAGEPDVALHLLDRAHEEMRAALANIGDAPYTNDAFPHIRVSPERAQVYYERLQALIADLVAEPPDPNGTVYGILVAMFRAPTYMQAATSEPHDTDPGE